MIAYHRSPEELLSLIAECERRIMELEACIARRSHDPAWGVTLAAATHDQIAQLPPDAPVIARLGDVRDLKLWNTAFGAQAPFDAVMRRGLTSFHLRAGDVFGRGDGGDKFYLVCRADQAGDGRADTTDPDAVIARINGMLRTTPLRTAERARYVRGVCAKHHGPIVGRLYEALHYLGIRPVADYPAIDFVPVADGVAGTVLERIAAADKDLFNVKAAR